MLIGILKAALWLCGIPFRVIKYTFGLCFYIPDRADGDRLKVTFDRRGRYRNSTVIREDD